MYFQLHLLLEYASFFGLRTNSHNLHHTMLLGRSGAVVVSSLARRAALTSSSRVTIAGINAARFSNAADGDARDGVLKLRSARYAKKNAKVWDAYLATDPSSDGFAASAADVFRAIDVNRNLNVSVDELSAFLETVNSKGLNNETTTSFLKELGEDHELDEEEFRQFLNLATNPGSSIPASTEKPPSPASTAASADSAHTNVSALRSRRATKLQKIAWNRYIETGEGSENVFRTIDVNRNLKISAQEIHDFLAGLDGKGGDSSVGLKSGAIEALTNMAEDHELTGEEFKDWLSTWRATWRE